MLAEKSLQEGKLDDALSQLQAAVRDDPSNVKYRVFLFQLLAVLGQWDRSLNQLNVAGELDPSTLAMVQTYRQALSCEVLRADIFAGKRSPLVFGEPEKWIALVVESLRLSADGKYPQAGALRDEAFEAAPATPGTIDGAPFEWIADADPRLGPILEVILNGQYYWVPFHRIRSIHMEEPEDLRDVVWSPAQFTWANSGQAVGLIPTRYAGSERSEDAAVRLARKTDWLEPEKGVYLGEGQRMFATDTREYSLMDVRRIDLNSTDAGGAESSGAEPVEE